MKHKSHTSSDFISIQVLLCNSGLSHLP